MYNLPSEGQKLCGYRVTVVTPAVHNTYKPNRYRKQSIPGHITIHNYFAIYFLCFLQASKTLNNEQRQSNSSTVYLCLSCDAEMLMSSAAIGFVLATCKCSLIQHRTNSVTFWFPWTDFHDSGTILQSSSCSTCPETKSSFHVTSAVKISTKV